MDEEAAIASLGSIDELAQKILAEQEHLVPPAAPEPPKFDQEIPSDVPPAPEPKKRRMSPGIIVLLVLGSPRMALAGPGAGLRGLRHLDRRLGGARLPADCRGGYGLCRSSRRHLQLFCSGIPRHLCGTAAGLRFLFSGGRRGAFPAAAEPLADPGLCPSHTLPFGAERRRCKKRFTKICLILGVFLLAADW